MPNPALIVIGGGKREYRGYILERISQRYPLVLLSPQPPTWEVPYIVDHFKIDPADSGQIMATALDASRSHDIGGVATFHEACVVLVAKVAQSLGLPHCDPVAAGRCRDKYAAREALQRAGVPSARYMLVHATDEARKAAAEIGYPVVVKPRGLTASFGVSLATDPAALEEAFDCALSNAFPEPWEFRHGVMIEEFLDGPEISVDSALYSDKIESLIFAKKVLGFAPYFEELGHIVTVPERDAPDLQQVRSVVAAAHLALGLSNMVTHAEVRLTAAGPRIIEINGRLGGDLIPLVARVASGIDFAMGSADIAMGAPPELSVDRNGIAGIRFFYSRSSGRVTATRMAGALGHPDWLHLVEWLVSPGEEIRPVPGRFHFARVGYGVVTAATTEECAARMEAVDRHHVLELAPLAPRQDSNMKASQ